MCHAFVVQKKSAYNHNDHCNDGILRVGGGTAS